MFQSSPWAPTLFMYAAFAAIIYFLFLRPQQLQRKKHETMVAALKRGDEIVTAGGLVGEVVNIKEIATGKPGPDDRITIKSGESRVVVERGRIARVGTTAGTTSAAPPSASTAG
jgi:preprotein translocase subunit YajC